MGAGYEVGDPDRARMKMWFSRNDAVDAKARSFIPHIRAAGRSELVGDEWHTQDGMVAQLVRGTPFE